MHKFLVTNDDGINSEGLKALVRALANLGEVYAVAPAEEQSGKSMGITYSQPITVRDGEVQGAEKAHIVTGTPVDCVKWAIDAYEGKIKFDYVISGINLGVNYGAIHFYSGTVAAAREGAIQGIHSIALSLEGHHSEQFDYICSMLPDLISMSKKLDPGIVLNVNAPDIPYWKVKGVKVVPGAEFDYGETYHFVDRGNNIYQMEEGHKDLDFTIDNDINALAAGYATITPLAADIYDKRTIGKLKGIMTENPIFIILDAQEYISEWSEDYDVWEKNISKWVRCIDRIDMPILVAELYGEGSTIAAITDSIEQCEIVQHTDFNLMNTPEFEQLLDTGMSRRVYLAGYETHISIQQTAGELMNRGYDVVLVEDCCTAKNFRDHHIALDNLRAAGCKITTCEAAIMELLDGTRHPAFRTIAAILAE